MQLSWSCYQLITHLSPVLCLVELALGFKRTNLIFIIALRDDGAEELKGQAPKGCDHQLHENKSAIHNVQGS